MRPLLTSETVPPPPPSEPLKSAPPPPPPKEEPPAPPPPPEEIRVRFSKIHLNLGLSGTCLQIKPISVSCVII